MFSSTATIDLGMVCQDQWKKSFAQSLYMAGMLVGSFLFGTMADWTGRRITLGMYVFYTSCCSSVDLDFFGVQTKLSIDLSINEPRYTSWLEITFLPVH